MTGASLAHDLAGAQDRFTESGELGFAKFLELLARLFVVAPHLLERRVEVGQFVLGLFDPGSDLCESLAELIDDGWFHIIVPFVVVLVLLWVEAVNTRSRQNLFSAQSEMVLLSARLWIRGLNA